MNHVYVSMFGPLPDRPTGLAMSVLRRAQAFAKAGTRTTILVDQFSPDLDRHISGLRAGGSLNEGMIEVRSMHLDLAGRGPLPLESGYASPSSEGKPGWKFTQDDKKPEVWRGHLNGDYREFVWMRGDKVHFIDYLTDPGNTRINRTWFDEAGRPFKIEHMNEANKPSRVEHLRETGETYLTHYPAEPQKYAVISASGTIKATTYDDLYYHWLSEHVLAGEESPTIISEYAFRRAALERVDNASVTYTLHNTHLAAPYGYGAALRGDQPFLPDLPNLPSVVVLTQEQKFDLQKQFGGTSNIHVVPHHAHFEDRTVERNPLKAVMVGRFEKVKGHLDAIQAFARVVAEVPEATLDIWGRGSEEPAIQKEIDRLGINDSVKLMGFTTDAESVFASAAVTLVPSSFEGFCLSMIEGMAQGCVPVVYNFKYGPADIVSDGVDGFIVERGNVADLGDTTKLLFKDSVLCSRMSDKAIEVRDRFTADRLIRDWREVLPTGVLA